MKRLLTPVICLCAFVPAPSRAAAHREGLTLIVVDAPDIAALHAAKEFVHDKGGRIGVMVPPSILIGWVDPAMAPALEGHRGIREIRWTEAPAAALRLSDEQAESAVRSFNAIVSESHDRERGAERSGARDGGATGPRAPDGITPPDLDVGDILANLDGAGIDASMRSRLGITLEETGVLGNSDAMTGTVAATFFLVESDGSQTDPDVYTWTVEDMQRYMDSALDGLLWWSQWAGGYRDCWVTFLVNHYSAFDPRCRQWVEPILHESSYVSVWSSNVMGNFGYTSGNHFSRVTAFNTWQRATYQTHRAFSAFIAYNPAGSPLSFPGGGTAAAWLYGPYFWSLFRVSGWTRDVVVSHETGHIFGACDEYLGGCSSCTSWCDIQQTPNANCEACNPMSRPCMMRSNENSVCQYTRGMLGWDVSTPCAPAPPAPLPAPAVAAVMPGGGLQGVEVNFSVTGSNFVAGVQVDLGPGVFVHETVLVDGTMLAVWASILNEAPAGPVDLVVRNRDGQSATLADGFEIMPTIHHYYSPAGGNEFPYITPETAGTSLTNVIAAAAPGDIVRVPSMTFSGFSIVIDKGLVLEGAWDAAFSARDLETGKTVLDLNGMVDFVSVVGAGLDGFLVENGDGRFDVYPYTALFAGAVRALNSTISLANCEIRTSTPQPQTSVGYGGALFAYQSDVTIDNCRIHDNSATRGGALYLDQCSGTLTNTTFDHNQVVTAGVINPEGSGIYLVGCSNVVIENCVVLNNAGGQNGGGVLAENSSGVEISGGSIEYNQASNGGGGVHFKTSSGSITGARVANNSAIVGGGAWLSSAPSASIRECEFAGNTASFGGGLLADGPTLHLDHNLLVGNVASGLIGGAGLSSATGGSVIGNTLDGNSAGSGAGGLSLANCAVPVFNNIVVNSTGIGIGCSGNPPSYLDENNVWSSSAGDYSGCAGGSGSVSQDPLFVDALDGDHHLAVHSPCIDRGRPDPAYDDPDGSRGDMGRYGSHAFAMDQPAYPKNPVVEPGGTLRWSASAEPDVAKYAVYGGYASGFTPGSSTFLAFVTAPDTFLSVDPADSLCYRVSAVDADGYASGYSDEACASPATAVGPLAPRVTRLHPNIPNPFNPRTTIRFELAATAHVRLAVYDVTGRLIATLVDGVRAPGLHDVPWNGTDDKGAGVASGVYFCRLTTPSHSQTRKMLLLK